MSTPYQSQYWAAQLALNGPSGSIGQLGRSISNASVDLNPHQVDAALFAVSSPLSKGAVLADEVGLGKTIEAGLVLAQRWAERRRRILVIVPATLRKQWAQELADKFHIPTRILESRSFNKLIKSGVENPFADTERVVICSYHFAANKAAYVALNPWDLVIIDEAHRLRNVYKSGNKLARTLRDSLGKSSKLLLTATPLQNTLMELYGLVSFVDPHVFGDETSFREQFLRATDEDQRNADLRKRLRPVCHRTLRRQVREYVSFTARVSQTFEFFPTEDEQRLYDEVSTYLQRETLQALPKGQRHLMTMVLRKLLASSSFAIAGTLRSLVGRLEKLADAESAATSDSESAETDIGTDYEGYDETREEWDETEAGDVDHAPATAASDADHLQSELSVLREYLALAERIEHNSKGEKLVEALATAFEKTTALGGVKKAVVFTESRRTQAYLFDLLERSGYEGKVAIVNGTNTDQRSKDIYKDWLARHEGEDIVSGSRPVDVKAALVEEFRDRATILVATEAAAEGTNLQFCSLVVNYDLPWNPQRIEQRIGRCHRYGQAHDVVVVNFLNKNNAADERVYELLAEKFHLFEGVFGSSDEVLGALESGVDVERRIADIYQRCRTQEDIAAAFADLRAEIEDQIQDRLAKTRQVVLDYFDEEVHQRLRVHRDQAHAILDDRGKLLLSLARTELAGDAVFEEGVPRFHYRGDLARPGHYHFDWKQAERLGDGFFRTEHPLAQAILARSLERELATREVVFDYGAYGASVAILAERVGQRGFLRVEKVSVTSIDNEDHLLVTAVTDDAEVLDAEWCDRLLNLPATVGSAVELSADQSEKLDALIDGELARTLEDIELRNGAYFEAEVDKLDSWAEDLKLTLERELKELDVEIRAARKSSKTGVMLAEKLEAQRHIKALEKRRNEKRRQLYDAQDKVDQKRSEIIDSIEKQLATSAQRETLFTLRWLLNR